MKRIFYILMGFVYLAAILLCLVIMVKPGASIFYKKTTFQIQGLVQSGKAFEVQFRANQYIYDPKSLLIFENNASLRSVDPESVEEGENGTFALKTRQGDQMTVVFVPATRSAGAVNQHTYRIYIRPYLIKSNWGGLVFWMLSLGLVVFFGFNILNRIRRKGFLRLPFGQPEVRANRLAAKKSVAGPFIETKAYLFKNALVNSILVAYLYIFMEWIFYVTKPSFMDVLTLAQKINIFLIVSLAAALVTLTVLLVIFVLEALLTPIFPSLHKYAYNLPLVFILTCLGMILIDNFTYTVFKFGIVSTTTFLRAFYGLAFVGAFIYILIRMGLGSNSSKQRGSQRIRAIAAIFLFVFSFVLAGFTIRPESLNDSLPGNNSTTIKKPNIILLSIDGVNATELSVYGYSRETTPFITELAKTSLISENNFTNASVTTGSITSVLTGKLPFSTRIIQTPDTLRGADMYQHLPAVLKGNGYLNAQIPIQKYTDANTINFKDAFDSISCVKNSPDSLSSFISRYGYDDEVNLFKIIMARITDRLLHIFFIKVMQNPYTQVTQPSTASESDQDRLNCLRSYLNEVKQTGQPLFVELHLLETHGPTFKNTLRYFSKNETQNKKWMTDFYDDAILSFDENVKQLVQFLKDNGQFDNTILVLYSDHGEQWTVTDKIPQIIHFPGDQHAGAIKINTQNIDIAPTILDYMGIAKPEWMQGSSLLGNLDPKRLILAGYLLARGTSRAHLQISSLVVIQCKNTFTFDLADGSVEQSKVANYVNACSADKPDSEEVIREKAGKILKTLGYPLPAGW